MSRQHLWPVNGRARHKCTRCKYVTEYSGVLCLCEPKHVYAVRCCPVCGSPVVPKEDA